MFARFLLVASLAASSLAATLPLETRQAKAQVVYKCTKPKTVALTFDDGPFQYTEKISKAIIAAGGKATFFFNGKNYDCIYNSNMRKNVKLVYDAGHQVASHTWAHLNLAQQSVDKVHDEMWKVELALRRITGATPAFMRPPFGSFNDNVLRVAAQRGQTVAIWDLDSGDSAGKTTSQSLKIYDDALAKNPNNILTLNHETYAGTANTIVPEVIKKLKAKGYKMVTLAECLGKNPYQSVQAPETFNSATWKC